MARAPLVLDVAASVSTLRLGLRRVVTLRGRGQALVLLLTHARRLEQRGKGSGWVTTMDISQLPEWTSSRAPSSLRAQIRREIKHLQRRGFDVIEAGPRSLLKGPFRLRELPCLSRTSVRRLDEQFKVEALGGPREPVALFDWLEQAEPVWRAAYAFDKGSGIDVDQLRRANGHWGPVVRVVACITRVRSLRDYGDYAAAETALADARQALAHVGNRSIRQSLDAQCWVQQGWIDYRRASYEDTMACAARAIEALHGQGELRVLGQILGLRSLVHRRQQHFDEALHDLRLAAEHWLVAGDLYNLLSTYHNLSCVLMDLAERERDQARAASLLKQAITCCRQGESYCRNQNVAQNTVISKLQLSTLYQRVGDWPAAIAEADRAREEALDAHNWSEALLAYRHGLRARLMAGRLHEARQVTDEFAEAVPDEQTSRVRRTHREILAAHGNATRRHIRPRRITSPRARSGS